MVNPISHMFVVNYLGHSQSHTPKEFTYHIVKFATVINMSEAFQHEIPTHINKTPLNSIYVSDIGYSCKLQYVKTFIDASL